MADSISKKPNHLSFRERMRQRLSIANYVMATLTTVCIVVTTALAVGSMYQIFDNGAETSAAISYLESEQIATELSTVLSKQVYCRFANGPSTNVDRRCLRRPNVIYQIVDPQRAIPLGRKSKYQPFNASDLGLTSLQFDREFNIHQTQDGYFIFKTVEREDAERYIRNIPSGSDKRIVFGYQFNPDVIFGAFSARWGLGVTAYTLNRQGTLIYGFSPFGFPKENIAERELVQSFVREKLEHGQLVVSGTLGERRYGSFGQIANTNLVYFQEMLAVFAVKEALAETAKTLAFSIILILIGVVFIRKAMRSVVSPLKQLTSAVSKIADGDFRVKLMPAARSFGEIQSLVSGFDQMAGILRSRDESIKRLLNEEKIRKLLSDQLQMAKSLQENFLPKTFLPASSGIDLSANYVPAEYVAGDWFTFHFNEKTTETVIILADVTGHDVAAAMFTAMVAQIFYEVLDLNMDTFPVKKFEEKVHACFERFGKKKWGVTLQVATYKIGDSHLQITNCGHVFPVHMFSTAKTEVKKNFFSSKEVEVIETKAKMIAIPSAPLGYIEKPVSKVKKIPFGLDDTIFMYTDGVTETTNPEGDMFGKKRLLKILETMGGKPSHEVVARVAGECSVYQNGAPTSDDMCIIVLRRLAPAVIEAAV